jgi:hypothetical protein
MNGNKRERNRKTKKERKKQRRKEKKGINKRGNNDRKERNEMEANKGRGVSEPDDPKHINCASFICKFSALRSGGDLG